MSRDKKRYHFVLERPFIAVMVFVFGKRGYYFSRFWRDVFTQIHDIISGIMKLSNHKHGFSKVPLVVERTLSENGKSNNCPSPDF
jgi:hypothetical protein